MMRALTLFLVAVLVLSAAHKAKAPDRLGTATARLAGVAGPVALVLMVLAGAVEAAAALCLLLPGTAMAGALIAAGLWTVYAAALWRRRGTVLDCGCDLVARPRPVGAGAIVRPFVLAALALAVLVMPDLPNLLALDMLAAVGGLVLYLAASEILAIPLPRWRTA